MHGPPRQDEPWRELARELKAAREESKAAELQAELGLDAIGHEAPGAFVWDLD